MRLGRTIRAIVAAVLLSSVGVRANQSPRLENEFAMLAEQFRQESLQTDRIDDSQIKRMHDLYRQTADAEDSQRRLASLSLGTHYLASNHQLALQYLSTAELLTSKSENLYPVIKYFQIIARMMGGAYEQAAKDSEELLKIDLGKSWQDTLYTLAIESHSKAGNHRKVISYYKKYERLFAVGKRSEVVMQRAVHAFEQTKQYLQAADTLEDLAGNYPVTELSRWAFRHLEELRCNKSAKNIIYSKSFLLKLARNSTLDIGTEEFIMAAIDQPIRVSRTQVETLSGMERLEFLFSARFYDDALSYAEQLQTRLVRKKNDKELADIKLMLGRINFRLRDYLQAARHFSEYLTQFPNSRDLVRVREYLADTYKRLDAYRLAADHYAGVAGKTRSRELRWAHFWNLFRDREYTKALNILEVPKYVTGRYRSEGDEVLYWRARLLEKLDRSAEAYVVYRDLLERFGFGFYAQMVAGRLPHLIEEAPQKSDLAKQVEDSKERKFVLAARLLSDDNAEKDVATAELKSIQELITVGLRQIALMQMGNVKWNDYDEEHLFASAGRLAMELGNFQPSRRLRYRMFSALRNLPSSWWDLTNHQRQHEQEWRIYYPEAYGDAVKDIAKRVELDPYFLMSIMRAESFYNKDARSIVGARGLMQIMPYTGARIAKLLDDGQFQASDLSIPEISVVYGGYYMNQLVQYYQGNFLLATAAYNAGPDAVNRWLRFCDDCEVDEFVESIPYRETRRYVMKVMQTLATYRRIYEGEMILQMPTNLPKTLPENVIIF